MGVISPEITVMLGSTHNSLASHTWSSGVASETNNRLTRVTRQALAVSCVLLLLLDKNKLEVFGKGEMRRAHLNNLLPQCECVDNAYPSCLTGENTNTVLFIFPPWFAKVVGPVRARTGRWDMDKPPHGSVGANAACQGVDMGFQLEGEEIKVFMNN